MNNQLLSRLQRSLLPPIDAWLQQLVQLATARHVSIFLVGGPVRDLLLGQPALDLDLVVDGDAWPVVEAFAAQTHGRLTKHAAFRTATVELTLNGEPFAIDLVTARRETYPQPAALPVVEPAGMHDDLFRRDFTINALALRLDHGELLDPYGGEADLDAKLVRVLHDASFHDDPTRILRAVRFAARLDFAIEQHTQALLAAALHDRMIERTSAQRILNELWLLLAEPQPAAALQLLAQHHALDQLGVRWNPAWPQQFRALRLQQLFPSMQRLVGWGLLVWPLDASQRQALHERYNLPGPERSLLQALPVALPVELSSPDLDAVTLEQVLQSWDEPVLQVLRLVAPPDAAANITRYLTQIRPLPPLLTGADLRALGIPPGPRYGQLLAAGRRQQLAGTLQTPAAARDWIMRQHTDVEA